MYIVKKCYLSFILCFFQGIAYIYAQTGTNVGLSGHYNLATQGLGCGVRLAIPLFPRGSLVPNLHYYPSGNQVHEMYSGIQLQYVFLRNNAMDFYLAAGAAYNNWLNAEEFENEIAKNKQFIPECSLGTIINVGCLKPFIEGKYHFRWNEGEIAAGIFLDLRCLSNKRGKAYICPTYL